MSNNLSQSDRRSESQNSDQINPKKLLDFGSKQIISLFVPVSICMIMVGAVAKTIKYYSTTDQYLIYTPFHTKDASVGTTIWQSLANALIMITLVVVMSVVLVLLYKYRCYKFIHGYLIVSTVIILFVLFTMFFVEAVIAMNILMDYLTLALFIWNFGIVGFLVIHWKGPLILQQAYLIIISAKIALILLKFMPLWTTWVVLGVLAIWDLVAVLCPFGPLRILVEIASERNEPIFPALIYSTTATMMANEGNETNVISNPHSSNMEEGSNVFIPLNICQTSYLDNSHILAEETDINVLPEVAQQSDNVGLTKKNRKNKAEMKRIKNASSECVDANFLPPNESINNEQTPPVQIEDDRARMKRKFRDIHDDVMDRGDRGVKLGLGDFVFYSLLMGRATLDSDPNTIVACYVAILVGMFLTILLLTMAGRALPALPISMACGILFYFITSLIISPFTQALALTRVFL